MAYGPYQQLADPSQMAGADQLANSPELWRALMQNQSAAPAAGDQLAMMEQKNRLLTRPTDFMGGGAGGGVKTAVEPGAKYEHPLHLENYISEWSKGRMSAKDVQDKFKSEGWSVDLRRGRSDVEAFDPSGYQHYLQP